MQSRSQGNEACRQGNEGLREPRSSCVAANMLVVNTKQGGGNTYGAVLPLFRLSYG